jgi:hypothetical protein
VDPFMTMEPLLPLAGFPFPSIVTILFPLHAI